MRIFNFQSCGWMPLTLVGLMMTGILCSYIWAVVRNDVVAFVPFISDAGGSPPQSGIFGIFLFLSAIMGTLTMFVRFYSVRQVVIERRNANYLNNGALFLGFISLLGMITVAAYPIHSVSKKDDWTKVVALPHTIGAFSTFFVGAIYAICQTVLTYILRIKSHFKVIILVAIRGTFCLCAFISVIVMVSYSSGGQTNSVPQNSTNTTTESPGGQWQSSEGKMVNSIAEWVLALMLIGFFLTMYPELKQVRISGEVENIEQPTYLQQNFAPSQIYGSTEVKF